MDAVNVFVSFDVDHDKELYGLLVEQSSSQRLGFSVIGGSTRASASGESSERVRCRIRKADQVIVICGERTEESMSVFAELRIAQEEGKPYILLWGRREVMCTKPAGTKPADGMYSWTPQILQNQIELARRDVHSQAVAKSLRAARGKANPLRP